MPTIQVPLDVPDDIYNQIRNGSLTIWGMVKDGNNRIRKHIPITKLTKTDKAHIIKNEGVLQFIKNNKLVLAGTLLAAAATGAGIYAYNIVKERKTETTEEKIGYFQKALKEYLKASNKGKLNTKVVDDLLSALNKLEEKKLGKDIELTIPASQLTELIFSIFTYTESLAKANDYNVKVSKPKSGTKGNIVSLKSYLEIQKDILEKTA